MNKTQVSSEQSAIPDPFDPNSFRIDQNYTTTQVKRVLTTIKVGKPSKEWFVRVNPDPAYQFQMALYELKDENETYMVSPSMVHYMEGMAVVKKLFVGQTRQGVFFLWPVKLPDVDGKLDSWNISAHATASKAETQWVSMRSNRAASCYDTFVAMGDLPEPDWSELPKPRDVLQLAFKDKVISTPDHILIRKLRGEL